MEYDEYVPLACGTWAPPLARGVAVSEAKVMLTQGFHHCFFPAMRASSGGSKRVTQGNSARHGDLHVSLSIKAA
jgi:hypothetical protein